jgi:hypothetical protein
VFSTCGVQTCVPSHLLVLCSKRACVSNKKVCIRLIAAQHVCLICSFEDFCTVPGVYFWVRLPRPCCCGFSRAETVFGAQVHCMEAYLPPPLPSLANHKRTPSPPPHSPGAMRPAGMSLGAARHCQRVLVPTAASGSTAFAWQFPDAVAVFN